MANYVIGSVFIVLIFLSRGFGSKNVLDVNVGPHTDENIMFHSNSALLEFYFYQAEYFLRLSDTSSYFTDINFHTVDYFDNNHTSPVRNSAKNIFAGTRISVLKSKMPNQVVSDSTLAKYISTSKKRISGGVATNFESNLLGLPVVGYPELLLQSFFPSFDCMDLKEAGLDIKGLVAVVSMRNYEFNELLELLYRLIVSNFDIFIFDVNTSEFTQLSRKIQEKLTNEGKTTEMVQQLHYLDIRKTTLELLSTVYACSQVTISNNVQSLLFAMAHHKPIVAITDDTYDVENMIGLVDAPWLMIRKELAEVESIIEKMHSVLSSLPHIKQMCENLVLMVSDLNHCMYLRAVYLDNVEGI
ncbi:hypothetical protein PCE1_002660 [Barthelona sp. PCE]